MRAVVRNGATSYDRAPQSEPTRLRRAAYDLRTTRRTSAGPRDCSLAKVHAPQPVDAPATRALEHGRTCLRSPHSRG